MRLTDYRDYADAIINAIENPTPIKEKGSAGEWYEVKKCRPEINQTVLTYREGCGIKIRTYKKSALKNEYGEFGIWSCYSYTPSHWMPLPRTPKEENR